MKSTGDRIRAGRTKLGYTQPELADLLGLSNGAISQWETGGTKPTGLNLLNLAATLKMSPDYIMTGEEPDRGDGPFIRARSGSDPALEEVSEIMTGLSEEDRITAVALLRALARPSKQ